ncbi:unnamed protein product [Meloidogyne enterolobii]|uniref:Uncharacterized protein n=1 Tax=Meloidogyne enterolobii TaxID=390850 RepID=A0ACB0YGI9_MELEN
MALFNRRWRDQLCLETDEQLANCKADLFGFLSKWIAATPEVRELTTKNGTKQQETTTILECEFPLCRAILKLVEVTTGAEFTEFVSGNLFFSSIEHSEHDGRNKAEITSFLKGDEFTGPADPVYDPVKDIKRTYRDSIFLAREDAFVEQQKILRQAYSVWIPDEPTEEEIGKHKGIPIVAQTTTYKCRNGLCHAKVRMVVWLIAGKFNKAWMLLSTANHRLHDCRTPCQMDNYVRGIMYSAN